MSDDEASAEQVGPIEQIQEVLAQLDPDAMVLGFVTIAEWLEPDGSHAMSVLNTSMAPWHYKGLLDHARDQGCRTFMVSPEVLEEIREYLELDDDED